MSPALWLGTVGALLVGGALAARRRGASSRTRRSALLLGGLLLVPGLLGIGYRGSLAGYVSLPRQEAVATIHFARESPDGFVARLQLPGSGAPSEFPLNGDEWQIDARILTWKAWAAWLGMKPLYRFERLSGRYTDIRDEQELPRSVHALSETRPPWWQTLPKQGARLPGGDAYYGTAAFLPMADGAAYVISVSTSGLVVRPDNPAAERAVDGWGMPR